jgi:hypothetical protein
MPIIERDEHGKLVKTCGRPCTRCPPSCKHNSDAPTMEHKPGRSGKFTTRNMKYSRTQKEEHKASKVYTTWKPTKGCK